MGKNEEKAVRGFKINSNNGKKVSYLTCFKNSNLIQKLTGYRVPCIWIRKIKLAIPPSDNYNLVSLSLSVKFKVHECDFQNSSIMILKHSKKSAAFLALLWRLVRKELDLELASGLAATRCGAAVGGWLSSARAMADFFHAWTVAIVDTLEI